MYGYCLRKNVAITIKMMYGMIPDRQSDQNNFIHNRITPYIELVVFHQLSLQDYLNFRIQFLLIQCNNFKTSS